MKIETYIKKIQALHACEEAVEAAGKYTTSQELWDDCGRGDWMLWLIARTQHDRKQLVLATCACLRLSLKYVPAGENRPRMAIETAEKWARDEGATLDDIRAAANAFAAANAAYATLKKGADIVRGFFPKVDKLFKDAERKSAG